MSNAPVLCLSQSEYASRNEGIDMLITRTFSLLGRSTKCYSPLEYATDILAAFRGWTYSFGLDGHDGHYDESNSN